MNVLILGVNTRIAEVFKEMSADVTIVCYKGIDFRHMSELTGYNIINSEFTEEFKNSFKIIKELREILKNEKSDLIFSNTKFTMLDAYICSLFIKKRPFLISTSHNSYAWRFNNLSTEYIVKSNEFVKKRNFYLTKKIKIFFMSKLIGMTTDLFIALASFVSDILKINGIDDTKILILPNSINSQLFKQKKNYEFNNNFIDLVYIGVIYEGKGHKTLLEAVNILTKKGILVRLTIFGDILDEEFYESLILYLNNENLNDIVYFNGKIENSVLKESLCNYDIYVCPSYLEMSPNNILEAKAAGLPIICTNVGGIPDIITDGFDGIFVTPGESNMLAKKIENFSNDKSMREKLGRNAFESVIVKHSAKVSAEKIKVKLNSLNN